MLRVSVNLSGRDRERERPAVLQPQLLWFYPSALVSQGSEGDVARVLKHEVVDTTCIILGSHLTGVTLEGCAIKR